MDDIRNIESNAMKDIYLIISPYKKLSVLGKWLSLTDKESNPV